MSQSELAFVQAKGEQEMSQGRSTQRAAEQRASAASVTQRVHALLGGGPVPMETTWLYKENRKEL